MQCSVFVHKRCKALQGNACAGSWVLWVVNVANHLQVSMNVQADPGSYLMHLSVRITWDGGAMEWLWICSFAAAMMLYCSQKVSWEWVVRLCRRASKNGFWWNCISGWTMKKEDFCCVQNFESRFGWGEILFSVFQFTSRFLRNCLKGILSTLIALHRSTVLNISHGVC